MSVAHAAERVAGAARAGRAVSGLVVVAAAASVAVVLAASACVATDDAHVERPSQRGGAGSCDREDPCVLQWCGDASDGCGGAVSCGSCDDCPVDAGEATAARPGTRGLVAFHVVAAESGAPLPGAVIRVDGADAWTAPLTGALADGVAEVVLPTGRARVRAVAAGRRWTRVDVDVRRCRNHVRVALPARDGADPQAIAVPGRLVRGGVPVAGRVELFRRGAHDPRIAGFADVGADGAFALPPASVDGVAIPSFEARARAADGASAAFDVGPLVDDGFLVLDVGDASARWE